MATERGLWPAGKFARAKLSGLHVAGVVTIKLKTAVEVPPGSKAVSVTI